MAAVRGTQNGRQGLERGLPLGFLNKFFDLILERSECATPRKTQVEERIIGPDMTYVRGAQLGVAELKIPDKIQGGQEGNNDADEANCEFDSGMR